MLKKQIKMNNIAKILKTDSDSPNLKDKKNMIFSSRNENNQKFDAINEENFRKENIQKIYNKMLKSYVFKKIENIPKSSVKFENEFEKKIL